MEAQTPQEFEIFFSASHQFRNRKVMDFETQAGTRSGVFIAHRDEPTSPSIRQDSSVFTDSMGVVAKCLMERGTFADATVDQLTVVRTAQRENVSLH